MTNLTLLYVEDEELVHCLIARYLATQVESVFTARDGVEGLKAFIACRPGLVITDIEMPHLDGLQMAARIRAIQPVVPFVFLTASPEKVTQFDGFNPRLDRVLPKPLDLHTLAQLLERYAGGYAKYAGAVGMQAM
jgi:CheY-like chemotaxis protein